MVEVLLSWADVVTEKGSVADCSGRSEIGALASFLLDNLDWLTAHPAAADFAGEIAGLVAAAGSVLSPDADWRIALGRCVESGCDGTIYATVRSGNAASVPRVGCNAGHTWQAHQWLQLGWQVGRSEQPAYGRAGR